MTKMRMKGDQHCAAFSTTTRRMMKMKKRMKGDQHRAASSATTRRMMMVKKMKLV
jgi:hypothetical protein